MGTWGSGLYDNDAALDRLTDLVEAVPFKSDVAHLAAALGLRLWMNPPVQPERVAALANRATGHPAWSTLDAAAREALQPLIADETWLEKAPPGRSEASRAVLGTYCEGPFIAPLFEVDGALVVVEERLVVPCCKKLDAMARAKKATDLYEAARTLVHLGPLLELVDVGLMAPERLEGAPAWLDKLDAIDRNTPQERSFWNEFMGRLRPALHQLVHPDAAIAEDEAKAYAPSATFEEGDIIRHPKFGLGRVHAVDEGRIDVEFAAGFKKLGHRR